MALDYENRKGEHTVTLIERKILKISGVDQILSFDDGFVLLSSSHGEIEITGSALNVDALDLEKGYAAISGDISGIDYVDERPKKKKRFWG